MAQDAEDLRRDLAAAKEALAAEKAKLQSMRESRGRAVASRDKLRESLTRSKETLDRANDELSALRGISLDVFPGIDVPEQVRTTIQAVRAERLSYLGDHHLRSLASCVLEAGEAGREGLILEAGTALGGSAIVMATAKDPKRPMKVYDVFGMIPPPSDADGADVIERYQNISAGEAKGLEGDVYYGYHDDLLGEVTESFARHGVPAKDNNIELVQGLFQDTIEIDEPVALAHVDGDWYESTMVCLTRIAPHLAPGGRIVIDDYWNWSGCRTAVDEFMPDHDELRIERRAKVHIVRK